MDDTKQSYTSNATPESPTVSVIIPTRNRPKELSYAVQSVLQQTYQQFEIIIIDDASNEPIQKPIQKSIQKPAQNPIQTSPHLNHILNDPRIHILRNEEALGGSASRNRGIFASQGKWIAFLDDDDSWLPQKLEQQLQLLMQNPKAIAASCAYIVHYLLIPQNPLIKNVNYKRIVVPPSHVTFAQLLASNCMGGASVCLCDAATVKQLGGFDVHLKSAQDWDLWLRLRHTGDIVCVAEPLVNYQVHFKARISNNFNSKYAGARRFYFKYQTLMHPHVKRQNLKFLCFLKSRQNHRTLRFRLKHLLRAISNNTLTRQCTYLLSSLPRMLIKRQ